MRAISQITITNICDVITSETPPENPYEGQLWVSTLSDPPQTFLWDGTGWHLVNDGETVRDIIEQHTEKLAEYQQNMDGLNSYVSGITETVQTLTDSLGSKETRILEAERQISELKQSMSEISMSFTDQFVGGINYIKNSAGLNGLTDDWVRTGTVSVDASTEIQNSTASDSAFVLSASSTLKQTITGVVTGTSYVLSLRAKKDTSSYSSYVRVQYNGNKYAYAFSTTTAFGWTEYSVIIPDVQDTTLVVYCYNRSGLLYVSDMMLAEGTTVHKWTPAPNEIYTSEVKIDRRGIEVSNSSSAQRTVINNTEFSGYYNEEKIFTLNKDETKTKKTTVDGELTVGNVKFVPMADASEGLNIVILD